MWHYNCNRQYSIKSGYKVFMSSHYQPLLTSSDVVGKMIWALRVPGKMNNFLWNVLHNVLPTCDNLWMRSMVVPKYCLFCTVVENVDHILFTCPFAATCWRIVDFIPSLSSITSLKIFCHAMLHDSSMEILAKCCVLLWVIWGNKNKHFWNHCTLSPLQVVS